jgi:hypothetical protein
MAGGGGLLWKDSETGYTRLEDNLVAVRAGGGEG